MRMTLCFCVTLMAALCPVHGEENPIPRLEQVMNGALNIVFLPENAQMSQVERARSVRTTVEKQFDLGILIRRTFGRNWSLIAAEHKVQLTEQVKQLLVQAFVAGMIGKNRPKISFQAPDFISEKRLEVATKITVDQKVYNITYRLGRLKSGWQIYDVVAEGISMVASYRQQIDDHFRGGDDAALIAKLDALLRQ